MKILTTISLTLLALSARAEEYYPKPLLRLGTHFSHHVLIAEKSTHSLYLYENKDGLPHLLQKYQMATGKKAGDKSFQGDHRTPEGIYHFTEFLTHQQLLQRNGTQGEIYGVGAFVMNYPNPIDVYDGKTGGGIWLHSTNDETRIDKGLDSRGCIVAHNENLIKISNYIELDKTNIVVVHDLHYLSKQTWLAEKQKLETTVSEWLNAWTTEDFDRYISHYSQKEFKDPTRGNFSNYRSYKRAVFANPGAPTIKMKELSILQTNDYAIATFIQDYTSNTIQDIGKKILYLKKDQYYNWKIVAERWSKVNDFAPNEVAFEPSKRFFESEDPKQIFTKALNLTQDQSNHTKN